MATASTPNFTTGVRRTHSVISAANTNRDGTGTIVTAFTAGASFGSLITRVNVKATGTTTAGMIRFFLHDGSNFGLFEELDVLAVTPSATAKTWIGSILFGASDRSYSSASGVTRLLLTGAGILLPVSHSLRVSTHNAETFHVSVAGGDYSQ